MSTVPVIKRGFFSNKKVLDSNEFELTLTPKTVIMFNTEIGKREEISNEEFEELKKLFLSETERREKMENAIDKYLKKMPEKVFIADDETAAWNLRK